MKHDIIEIRNHERGSVVALFKKSLNIVRHSFLKDHNLRAFIPAFRDTRTY